jgi:hypothetical protein
MGQRSYRTPAIPWLTTIVACLALVASLGGLFIDGLYKDNELIRMAWFANDLVTIAMTLLLVVSLLSQKQEDERPVLVWMGLMLYMFYNYAFYLFGARFNEFFLIYVALFSLSLYSIIIGLLNVNIQAIYEASLYAKGRLLISGFLFLLAMPLFIVEIKECLTFVSSGIVPQIPALIIALDLSIVIPTTVLASILLWRNHPWGNVLATMMLVKSFAYGLVLVTGTLLITGSGISSPDTLLPFYAFLVIGGSVFGWIHLKNLRPAGPIASQTFC